MSVTDSQYAEIKADRRRGEDVLRHLYRVIEERDEAREVACKLWNDCNVKNVLRFHEKHPWLLEEPVE